MISVCLRCSINQTTHLAAVIYSGCILLCWMVVCYCPLRGRSVFWCCCLCDRDAPIKQWRLSRAWGGGAPPSNKKYRGESIFSPLKVFAVFWVLRSPECVCGRGSAYRPPRLVQEARCPVPQTPPPLSAFGLGVRPFRSQGPVWVSLCPFDSR